MTREPKSALPVSEQPHRILPTWPSFDEDDIAAVSAVLLSGKINYWTGTEGRTFEAEFAQYVGTRHAVALTNGTVALELALRAFGIGPGDEVLTASRSFIASATCAAIVGAKPVFADVDPDSQNLTAATLEPHITSRTRVIIAVHFAGWPCDMDPILNLALRHNLRIIEDCAQAHGARYRGRSVGSLGDIGAWSFCQDKIITTGGEGGMITVNDDTLKNFVCFFKDHGRTLDESSPSYMKHEKVGTNSRMTEMQSALGRAALPKLTHWLELRRRNARLLAEAWAHQPLLRIPEPPSTVQHAYYKFYVFLRPERLQSGWTRERLIHEINDRGVPCSAGGRGAIHHEKVFAADGPVPHLPVTDDLAATSLVFQVHPTLSPDNMAWIAETVASVVSPATR